MNRPRLPRDRVPYSAIIDRPALVLPGDARMIVWTIVNVEDVEAESHEQRLRRDLGTAAGSRWTGLRHIEAPAGTLTVVPHCHSAEEEIFVVLDGEGTLELYRDEEIESHRVRRGSVVARPPGTGVPHTFRAGEETLTILAWGSREPNDVTWYPRSKKLWLAGGIIFRVEKLDYWDGEELRGLVRDAEAWARADGDERAREAVARCDAALAQPVA